MDAVEAQNPLDEVASRTEGAVSQEVEDEQEAEPGSENDKPLVFISYRHDPDEPLAAALKRLISRAIEPTPNVFVSGDRGLRPSNIGYKPQLQNAVKASKAFVAIITPSSLDREWMYYEAGAAWGLGQVYAPLLIGTTSKDLGATIADYQATRADNRQEVETLIKEIASAISGRVRQRFGLRYTAFLDTITEYSNKKQKDTGIATDKDPLWQAHILSLTGKHEEAQSRYAELESNAKTADERAEIRVTSIAYARHEGSEVYEKLSALPEEYRNTAICNLWLGLTDAYPPRVIESFKAAITISCNDPSVRQRALLALAKHFKFQIREDEATSVFLQCLRDTDGSFRAKVAEAWSELISSDMALFRILLLSYGRRARSTIEILKQAASIAHDAGWPSIALCYSIDADERAEGDVEANQLGRAFHLAKYYSLAYRAYARSAESGIGVSKVNMAMLLRRFPVPSAGLALLEAHQGDMRCSDPSLPFEIRARLEEEVEKERLETQKLVTSGRDVIRLMSDVFHTALFSDSQTPSQSYQLLQQVYTLTMTATGFKLASASASAPMPVSAPTLTGVAALASVMISQLKPVQESQFERVCAPLPLWYGKINDREYLLALDSMGSLTGVSFDSLTSLTPNPKVVALSKV